MADQNGPSGFIVMLADGIMEIPQDSYLSWMTLFYALPRELVEKRPVFLTLPRNIGKLLSDEAARTLIEDDSFLELVWDCYAWAAWQFFQVPFKDGTYHDIPGEWQDYSGDFPLWRMSYDIIRYFRKKFETEMDWSFQRLFLMPESVEIPWLNWQQFSNLIGNLTDMIVAEENWQPVIDEIWLDRQAEDYNRGKNSKKRDFLRSWYHDRTATHLSLEDIAQNGTKLDGDMLYDIEDPRAEFEKKVMSRDAVDSFFASLSPDDQTILRMRMEGFTQQQIADKLGFKTTGAISKRIAKIAAGYEAFAHGQYNDFLSEH